MFVWGEKDNENHLLRYSPSLTNVHTRCLQDCALMLRIYIPINSTLTFVYIFVRLTF